MDTNTFLGYAISAVVTLGAFIAVIMKFVQPINDLRIVIQKLNDNIDVVKRDNADQSKRIDDHDKTLNDHDRRIGKIETKMDMYHNH